MIAPVMASAKARSSVVLSSPFASSYSVSSRPTSRASLFLKRSQILLFGEEVVFLFFEVVARRDLVCRA